MAQGLFGMPQRGEIDYFRDITIDTSGLAPSIALHRRAGSAAGPHCADRCEGDVPHDPRRQGGHGVGTSGRGPRVDVQGGGEVFSIGHGSVLIAAVTSWPNTSDPSVMVAAGLLARMGLTVAPNIKTSLAPGSRAVTDHRGRVGRLSPLSAFGFDVVAFGCTTCIGFSGRRSIPPSSACSTRHSSSAAPCSVE